MHSLFALRREELPRPNGHALHPEDKGVCTAPQGLRCVEKMTDLDSEELLRLDSRNGSLRDVLTFSEPLETFPVKNITSEHRSENIRESECVGRVGIGPLMVSSVGTGDATTSSRLSDEQTSADGSQHSNTRLQDFDNTAEPRNKIRRKIAVQTKKRRSLSKQQLRTSRLVFVALILLSLLGHVNADAPASNHMWDFRNCVTGQDVLDTGEDGGKTASPVNVSNGLFGGRWEFIF